MKVTTLQGFLVRLAALAGGAALLAGPARPASAADIQMVANGDFSAGQSPWWVTSATVTPSVVGGVLQARVAPGTANPWNALVGQSGIAVTRGAPHTFSFDAWANTPVTVRAVIQLNVAPFTAYFVTSFALTTTSQRRTFTFHPAVDDPAAALQFQIGGAGAITVSLDNVSLTRPGAPTPPPARRGELLRNGLFHHGQSAPWWTSGASAVVDQGRLEATVTGGGTSPWDAIVGQSQVPLFVGGQYTLSLKAWASAPAAVSAVLQRESAPFTVYQRTPVALTTVPKTLRFTFTSTAEDPAAVLQLQLGGQGDLVVYLDNVSLVGPQPAASLPVQELLANGGFGSSLAPWWTSGNQTASTAGGALQVTILDGRVNPWDTLVGQNDVMLLQGGRYTLTFVASASIDVTVTVLIQKNGAPFTRYFGSALPLTTAPQTFTYTFTSGFDDDRATLQFQIGGRGNFTFNLDGVTLRGPKPGPPVEYLTAVRTNQVGYLPRAQKRATVATEATSPQAWTLFDAEGHPVASGATTVLGLDAASGEVLHTADFSSFEQPGAGYTLEAYGERSYPFDIGNDVLARLKYDALQFFYHSRSGIEIAMPYAGGTQWARAAGHVGIAPNQGDLDVPCFDGVDNRGVPWPGCSYTLNVTKGWYDAGDHGKYVVNGGLSTWLLLNEYERALRLAPSSRGALADGTSNIPENDNDVPDVLDEARWELEFLLSMQVPPGGGASPAGMVHHKVHDANWTGLGLAPANDPQRRYLYPPSTAATLNLAAVGAQCARIWRPLDGAFAQRCLAAAERAWNAALAHPAVPAEDVFPGGGGYTDNDVSDEFYWAAAELLATTGRPAYERFVAGSRHFLSIPVQIDPATGAARHASFGWSKTQALGSISLALNPTRLTLKQGQTVRANLLRAADAYAAEAAREPYGIPYSSSSGYHWGSNAQILNNSVVLGLAHDVTGLRKYVDALTSGVDYLLGRNPNARSYVTGWGERAVQHPHHRFWAPSLGAAFPPPPPGAVTGGPNQNLQDPYVQALYPGGCAPQTCYADHLDTYSTNEVTVNWNAALAWVAARLDDPRLKLD
jgi:endoglucanase